MTIGVEPNRHTYLVAAERVGAITSTISWVELTRVHRPPCALDDQLLV